MRCEEGMAGILEDVCISALKLKKVGLKRDGLVAEIDTSNPMLFPQIAP